MAFLQQCPSGRCRAYGVRYTPYTMQSKAETVEEYLTSLPEDRREALQTVRETILENLDEDFEEGMQYGMIGYFVPHSVYPAGYHVDPERPLPYAALASQKNYMALYLMGIYTGHPDGESENEHARWFREAWAASGKKLDMGKSCVRFRKLDDVPLDVVGEVIRRIPAKDHVAAYEATLEASRKGPRK